jgi:hypothetical protein
VGHSPSLPLLEWRGVHHTNPSSAMKTRERNPPRRVGTTLTTKQIMVPGRMHAVFECGPIVPMLSARCPSLIHVVRLCNIGLCLHSHPAAFGSGRLLHCHSPAPSAVSLALLHLELFWLRTLYNSLPGHYNPDVPNIRQQTRFFTNT